MPRTLRLAGVDVPRIGLGTNRLTEGHQGFLVAAVEAGVRLIDTAHVYTGGASERAIGAALATRQDVLIATKGGIGGAGRGRPEVLRAEIEESFQRLRRERIDLYYLHRVDPETEIEVSLGAIREYVEQGRIGHVGISAVTVEQVERARAVLPIAAVQNQYNLTSREHEAVVEHCTREGIPFVPYYPLKGTTPAVEAVAARLGATPAQVQLAWLLRRSPVMVPIPGTLSVDHVHENLAALDLELSEAEFEELSG